MHRELFERTELFCAHHRIGNSLLNTGGTDPRRFGIPVQPANFCGSNSVPERDNADNVSGGITRVPGSAVAWLPDIFQFGSAFLRKRRIQLVCFAVLLCLSPSGRLHVWAQQVVDRVAARVDEEIILQSDIEKLARYQVLVDGKSESEDQILDRLIDQWMVRKEAEASQFPQATQSDV